MLHIFSN